MIVRFAPEAREAMRQKHAWWEKHRDKAPGLFSDELRESVASLRAAPTESAQRYAVLAGRVIWRRLMPKTRHHILSFGREPGPRKPGAALRASCRWRALVFHNELGRRVPFTDHVREDADVGFEPTLRARTGREGASDETVRGAVLAKGRSAGTLRERTLRDALCQLALGVDAIHRAGMVHRDLKPSNVLVTRAGRVLILDFGLVSGCGAEAVGQTLLDEGISGTPAYMAPEQARGERATTASDWYAVGVMLFEALTGELPFGGSVFEVMQQKLSADASAPCSRLSTSPRI